MTKDQHISTIITEICPWACGSWDSDCDGPRQELEKLTPRLLEIIADHMAFLGSTIIRLEAECIAYDPKRSAEMM